MILSSKKYMKYFDRYIGKTFKTTKSGDCFVVDYKGRDRVTVMFHDGYYKIVDLKSLRTGKIKNPFHENNIIKGIGVTDTDTQDAKGDLKEYKLWLGILERCYDAKSLESNPAYNGCSISKSWKLFSNFQRDIKTMQGFDKAKDFGWHLDKDILIKGNRVYSKETCCFVPMVINNLMRISQRKRTGIASGLIKTQSNKFKSEIWCGGVFKYLGTFNTEEKAFSVYKKAKEQYIKEVANKWKDQIDQRVYEALMNYQVEITE